MTNQAIFQKREATKPTKKAVNAMNRLPYCRVVVKVAPMTRPRDQLVQVPRYTEYGVVESTSAHNVKFAMMEFPVTVDFFEGPGESEHGSERGSVTPKHLEPVASWLYTI